MKEPLSEVILLTIGVFIILLVLQIRGWIHNEFPKPKENSENLAQTQYLFYHNQANEALNQIAHLSDAKKRAIKRNLVSNLISLKQWLDSLNARPYEIICLGELHYESTRRFLFVRNNRYHIFLGQVKVQICRDVMILRVSKRRPP